MRSRFDLGRRIMNRGMAKPALAIAQGPMSFPGGNQRATPSRPGVFSTTPWATAVVLIKAVNILTSISGRRTESPITSVHNGSVRKAPPSSLPALGYSLTARGTTSQGCPFLMQSSSCGRRTSRRANSHIRTQRPINARHDPACASTEKRHLRL